MFDQTHETLIIARPGEITRAQMVLARQSGIKVDYTPIIHITCKGTCWTCPFAATDIDDEIYCTIPKSRRTIEEEPKKHTKRIGRK